MKYTYICVYVEIDVLTWISGVRTASRSLHEKSGAGVGASGAAAGELGASGCAEGALAPLRSSLREELRSAARPLRAAFGASLPLRGPRGTSVRPAFFAPLATWAGA